MEHLAQIIDTTLLRPDADDRDVTELARHGRDAGCAAVCIAPSRVPTVVSLLAGSETRVAAVIAFPNGAETVAAKCFGALEALRLGAQELDVVCDLAAVRQGHTALLEKEMGEIMARTPEAVHKFILQVDWLPAAAWKKIGKIARRLQPAFVKTGTGVHGGPASVEMVVRLREAIGPDVGLKAAGGIRTLEMAEKLAAAGATRLGTSSAAAILAQWQERR